MHSTKSHGGKISQLLALTVIVVMTISCGPEKVEDQLIIEGGTWEINKYQIFNYYPDLWVSNDFRGKGLYRNYDSLGQLQFNTDSMATYTYDSISVPFTWKKRAEESNVSDHLYDVLYLMPADTPAGNALRIPFLKNNIRRKVNTFRILTMEDDFILMRYRAGFNNGTNDTVSSVDVYLTRQ